MDAIDSFWSAFQAGAAAPERLREALHAVDPGLSLEIAPGELVISAEGHRDLFPLVERIVARAAPPPGWRISALKPKTGFPTEASCDSFRVRTDEAAFIPLENAQGELGLRLLLPGLRAQDARDAHRALLRAIDRGLGERRFAEAVAHTEVAPMPPSRDECIPLIELEAYIDWRAGRAV